MARVINLLLYSPCASVVALTNQEKGVLYLEQLVYQLLVEPADRLERTTDIYYAMDIDLQV